MILNEYILHLTVPQNIDEAVGTLQGNINDIYFDASVSGTIESTNDRVSMKISFTNVPREFQALSSLLTPMYLSVANKLEILQSSNGEFQHYTVVSFFYSWFYFFNSQYAWIYSLLSFGGTSESSVRLRFLCFLKINKIIPTLTEENSYIKIVKVQLNVVKDIYSIKTIKYHWFFW